MIYCDPQTGVCTVKTTEKAEHKPDSKKILDHTLLYFGDPMCSWCWGFAPQMEKVRDLTSQSYDFKLIMGGLRPGGGDPWNDQMKSFLSEHWNHVIDRSGQPFNFELFERQDFEYDTEPPCRAVKTAQYLLGDQALPFYHHIQHRFYAESKDPGDINFYKPICKKNNIDFSAFKEHYQSDLIEQRTRQDFTFTQRLGVQGFPSLLISADGQIQYLARGYCTADNIYQRLQSLNQ